jgi:uncharacterized protein YuzE
MKSSYDEQTDAIYIRFGQTEIVESEEVTPGVVFDFDSEGKIVGFEIYDVRMHVTKDPHLKNMQVA